MMFDLLSTDILPSMRQSRPLYGRLAALFSNSWRKYLDALICAIFLSGVIFSSSSFAQTASQTGSPSAGLLASKDEFNRQWQASPLGFSRARFVKARAKGYGRYDPREDNRFALGQPIIVYIEPVGYAHGQKNEQFEVSFHADLNLINEHGQIVLSKNHAATVSSLAHRPVYEFQISLEFQLEGIKPGNYILHLNIHDRFSAKSGDVRLPLSILAKDE